MATKTSIRPLEDRILVRPEEGEETTVSGIVIPDTAKEKPQEGTVLAVGPGKRSDTRRPHPRRRQRGRPRHVLEVRRHRDQGRRRRAADPLLPGRPRHRRLGPRTTPGTGWPGTQNGTFPRGAKTYGQDSQVRRGCPARARVRRQPSRQRRPRDARPPRPERRPRQEVGRTHDHERRRHDRQGDRARGPVGEHGGPARQGSRDQDERRRR